ncbi:MAG: EAL domain-containing protein [Gemmatimonadota bacterium]|nr:EAL domain-containing protein [Gemmatimonadota bacterium]
MARNDDAPPVEHAAFQLGTGQGDVSRSFCALESAFDAITDAILIVASDGRIVGFNAAFAEMWHIPQHVLALRSDERAISIAMSQLKDPENFRTRINELYAAPDVTSQDTLELLDGRVLERNSVPQRIDGGIAGRVWTFRDVTERNRMQNALRASEAKFRSVFDHSAVGIALIEPDGRMVAANPALQQFLGYTADELVNRRLYHLVPDEDADGLAAALAAISDQAIPDLTVEQRYLRRDGEIAWAALTMSRAQDSASGQALGIIAMVQDIGTRKSLEARLTHQASHDPLTNLANRTLFKQRVEVALQRARNRDQVVVMFLDVDNFKAVNDSAGHSAGDQLLVVAASRLLNATRGSDTVARFGGDEFAILLENVRDDDEARIVADRITRTMKQPIQVGEESVTTGVSTGIARLHNDGDGADELIRNADVAMYTAKGSGKGRYQFFEPAMHTAVVDRVELETELRRAVAAPATSFVLHYQSLVKLETNATVGVEALVRWMHPRRGELQPSEFITVAEETGLIIPLGRWVLREACRQAFAWWNDLPDESAMSMAVNISGRQLQDPSFVADVAEALADSGLPPSRLVLEITETVIMHRTEVMMGRLTELKTLGVHLAIDDFGTGYSSLSYLQQFPIDIIKIDRAFIEGMDRDPAGAALTRTIIGLGWTLGLSTVAEGVEHASQRETLAALGCGSAQGFLFARPVAAACVSDLVSHPARRDTL